MAPTRATHIEATAGADDTVTLTYEARLLRRRRLTSDKGRDFLVDLPQTVSVSDGEAFVLEDGARVAVRPAAEALLEVRGDLPRLAWHIGNRHAPCAIVPDRLLILDDHVMADMLARLGARVAKVVEPFTPEGGAYGHGRTFPHSHGGDAHADDHGAHG